MHACGDFTTRYHVRVRGVLSLAVALAGCGRFGFEEAPRLSDSGADAVADARVCSFGPWSTPQLIPSMGSPAGDFGGQVTADGLAFYFQSSRSGSPQIYVSRRPDRAAAWSVPVMVAELNTQAEQEEAAPTADELEIYFSSTRPSGGAQCIWHADRATKTAPFANITQLSQLCANGRESVGAFASADGLTLYYNTFETAPFGTIYESHRASRGDPFPIGTPVPGLESTGMKGYPWLSPDALTIYYEAPGTPGHHLLVATRADVASPFGAAVPIPNVDDNNDNEDVSLTADGLEIFFGSGRPGSAGDKDIFTASRSCD